MNRNYQKSVECSFHNEIIREFEMILTFVMWMQLIKTYGSEEDSILIFFATYESDAQNKLNIFSNQIPHLDVMENTEF